MPIKKKIKKSQVKNDPTYGQEPDLLDQPGIIVEPDVRKKIADYFKKMMLRETIRSILYEIEATGVQPQFNSIDRFEERKEKIDKIAKDVASILNLVDIRFLARSPRLQGAYTYSAVDRKYRNVILKIQSIDEMGGYSSIQQIRSEVSPATRNHLPIIFIVETLSSLGISNNENLCAIVMERLEELPGNMFELISASPARSKISFNAIIRDRKAFSVIIDKVIKSTNQSIIEVLNSVQRKIDIDVEISLLRNMLISASLSIVEPDDSKASSGIIQALMREINDKIDLWCKGLGIRDSLEKDILKREYEKLLKFELSSRAVPKEPLIQKPGALGNIRGIKELISAIDELKSMNIKPQDLHGNNIMLRPETGELVIADLGHFI